MNKKEFITPFLLIGLGLVFAFISFAVFLSHGKSKKWVARKMKIGGILLGLSAISTGTGCPTCYKPPYEPEHVIINQLNGYSIEIDLDTNNVLNGMIYDFYSSVFSFSIYDTSGLKKQTGLLIPSDGEFGDNNESFSLEIDTNLTTGNYWLNIYGCDIQSQVNQNSISEFNLLLK
jgi:hypothetical protein